MSYLRIWVPILPPGINQSYGVVNRQGKGDMYKTQDALIWQAGAALIIGSEAAQQNWMDDSKFYEIKITLYNSRHDVDANLKIVLDTVAEKLGFNDKKIVEQSSKKIQSNEKGILIELKGVQDGLV